MMTRRCRVHVHAANHRFKPHAAPNSTPPVCTTLQYKFPEGDVAFA